MIMHLTLRRLWSKAMVVSTEGKGNPHVGRALKGLLRESGFSNTSISGPYFEDGDLPRLTPETRKKLLGAATSVNLKQLPLVSARPGFSPEEEA